MDLVAHVIEARRLRPVGLNNTSDPYVKLRLGKHRAKTKVVKKTLSPSWDEYFRFRVGDLGEELVFSVYSEDKYFNDDFLGEVKVPLSTVFDVENRALGTAWYKLRPRSNKSKKKDRGEIHLTISFSQKSWPSNDSLSIQQNSSDDLASNSDKSLELKGEMPSSSPDRFTKLKRQLAMSSSNCHVEPQLGVAEIEPAKDDKLSSASFVDLFCKVFIGKKEESALLSGTLDSQEVQDKLLKLETSTVQFEDVSSNISFSELLKTVESKDQISELPENLSGGVLIDQSYAGAPDNLNTLLFSPSSTFLPSMAELQGTTDLQREPWRLENGTLKRVITYTKAASKLIKAVKATEEQTYLKADGKAYAVLASVYIPDVPCGTYFKTEILYCITSGKELPNGDLSSRLLISWRMNFFQSTMMRGMIENGAKQGLKESFAQFSDLLSQNVKPVDSQGIEHTREEILSTLKTKQESGLRLAYHFFGNLTVLISVIMGLYVFSHIILSNSSTTQGLEFSGLDLPDSLEEIVVCVILVLHGKLVLKMIRRYLQARKLRGNDHGAKAHGDGWLLTVALIEGSSLAAIGSSGFSDPYVVFTCNGKTKTSSIKFQTTRPHWNEVFEFDAMDDPPSRMDILVYDFDGPFDKATSLGHAEINFLKSNLSELADLWVPLQGKYAQACQSKLHLRIILNNTRGTGISTEYLTKMEKEVGKKINFRSPQTNSAFQKLFGLPPEEFLINDFTCHLKRKMPFQGRLFLSPRIIGFYSNLFGHKTKFFFLWEDIDDIQVIAPSLASVGSPSLMVILQKGRGMDAKDGAKAVDRDGRLKFHFQSFVSFHAANRTIMALWKARSLSPEQKVQIVEEQSEGKTLYNEDNASFLSLEDVKMSEVFTSTLPVPTNALMEIFDGGDLERRVMEKVGRVDYAMTPWEPVKSDVCQRQISYRFDENMSRDGEEVTSTQQKSPTPDLNGWIVEEVMSLQGALLGNYFSLQMKYQIEPSNKPKTSVIQVFLGIAWMKNTKYRKKITKNVMSSSSHRLKELFSQIEKELQQGK